MTTQQADDAATCPIALLTEIRRITEALGKCRALEVEDLAAVPDDMLREATNDLCEIRELAGTYYEPIAFQIGENDMAEIEAEEQATEAGNNASPPKRDEHRPYELPPEFEGNITAQDPEAIWARCQHLLQGAYAGVFRRIRNRDHEEPYEAAYRLAQFEMLDLLVAGMDDEARAHFSRLERTLQTRARQIHERVSARLRFWSLPAIPAPETYLQRPLTK